MPSTSSSCSGRTQPALYPRETRRSRDTRCASAKTWPWTSCSSTRCLACRRLRMVRISLRTKSKSYRRGQGNTSRFWSTLKSCCRTSTRRWRKHCHPSCSIHSLSKISSSSEVVPKYKQNRKRLSKPKLRNLGPNLLRPSALKSSQSTQ